MARSFTGGYYKATSNWPSSSSPITLAGWFYATTQSGNKTIVAVSNAFSAQWRWLGFGSTNPNEVIFEEFNGSGGDAVTGSVTLNTWHHACAVSNSLASRAVYYDGANKATDSTSITAFSSTALGIGALNDAGVFIDLMHGRLAEIGIWNVALSDKEVAALAKGFPCWKIRTSALIFYAPLLGCYGSSAEPDLSGSQVQLTQVSSPAAIDGPPLALFTPAGMMR